MAAKRAQILRQQWANPCKPFTVPLGSHTGADNGVNSRTAGAFRFRFLQSVCRYVVGSDAVVY